MDITNVLVLLTRRRARSKRKRRRRQEKYSLTRKREQRYTQGCGNIEPTTRHFDLFSLTHTAILYSKG